jgi:beta-glucanase (GH16 family)
MINARRATVGLSPRRSRSRRGLRASWLAALIGLSVASVAVAAAPAMAAAPVGPPSWSEEFDGASLDPARWSYRANGPRNDGILTPDAVSVRDGVLTIKTYTQAGKHYSGMISTQRRGSDGFEQTYGYFEARMKFNSSPGQWSAFWLQSPTIGSPLGDPESAGVEMDIAEHRARCVNAPSPTPPATCTPGNPITDRAQQALIWDGYGHDRKEAVKLGNPVAGLGDGGWHTWALSWTPTQVTFYRDDVATWTMNGPISRRSQHIILSSEVGEFFAGAIPAGGYGSPDTSTTNMQVDYVRAWTTPPPSTTTTLRGIAPPVDTRAPIAKLFASRSQKLRAAVVLRVMCPDEACRATATGTVRVPRLGKARAAIYKPWARTTMIAKGAMAAVKLKLSRSARVAIARALVAGRRIVLRLGVRVADTAGNIRPSTRHVTLRR